MVFLGPGHTNRVQKRLPLGGHVRSAQGGYPGAAERQEGAGLSCAGKVRCYYFVHSFEPGR